MRTHWMPAWCCLSACYLAPDTHPVRDVAAAEAGPEAVDAANADAAADGGAAQSDGGGVDATSSAHPAIELGCVSSLACSAERPLCRAGECVACVVHADCSRFPATPACGASGACVVCTADSKVACAAETPACDPLANRCVECAVDTDCTSEAKPSCGSTQTCGSCQDDADCARFGKVCDTKSASCVQCRPSSENADCRTDRSCDPRSRQCPGTACDPKQLVCTSKQRGSVGLCQACSADSECMADHRCIPLTHGEGSARNEVGTFCMKLATSGCVEPFRAAALTRESVSGGAATSYCGINEAVTSCAAIQALREDRDCSDASGCNAPGARCESVSFGATKTCTYSCSSNRECPSDVPCGTMSAMPYCGGP